VPYAYILCIVFGLAVSFLFYLPWSMVPDTVDLDELDTGMRREGLFFAFFAFIEKISSGLGLSLSNFILASAGYDANNPQPNPQVTLCLRLLVSVGPVILVALSVLLLLAYPVGKRRVEEIQSTVFLAVMVFSPHPTPPAHSLPFPCFY